MFFFTKSQREKEGTRELLSYRVFAPLRENLLAKAQRRGWI